MPTLETSGAGISSTESNVPRMWGGWALGTYEMIFANRIQWDGENYEQ